MSVNEGTFDRVVRVVIGLALLSIVLIGPKPWALVGFVGIVPLVTGLFGFCPLYKVLGVSTRAGSPRRTAGTHP